MSTVSDQIRSSYIYKLQNDKELRSITKRIRDSGGDYTDAEKYAIRTGQLLAEVLKKNITADNFPVGSVKEIASLLIPVLELNHDAVTQVAGLVQKFLNNAGGIGMNAIKAEFDRSGAQNLVGRMANYQSFEDAEWMLDEPIKTASLSVADNNLRSNADFQYKSGMRPKIIRTCETGACDWCRKLEGKYDYEDVKDRNNPVFQRHNNCQCEITYEPGDGRVQDVRSKQWYDQEKSAKRIQKYRIEENHWKAKNSERRQLKKQTGGSNRTAEEENTRKNAHAERYYEEIRNRKPYSDAKLIAQVVPQFTVEQIEEIRQHVFIREQPRDNRMARFDASYDVAQVWQRLTLHEEIWESDIVLLQHEYMELSIMKETGCVYEIAHDQTNLVYDWYEANKKDKMIRGKK